MDDAARLHLISDVRQRLAGQLQVDLPWPKGRHEPPSKLLPSMIDHTLLKADATVASLQRLCGEARLYGFATVCVNGANVPLCVETLAGSKVAVGVVVGFPLGAMSTAAKAFEARDAVAAGAGEVDMVINVGGLIGGKRQAVLHDIRQVVEAARPARVKVIVETALLSDEQKVEACLLAQLAGAHFVKTSTGFGPGGATVDDVRLMRQVVGTSLGVKASGGIRTRAAAKAMLAAGASRIGASASIALTG